MDYVIVPASILHVKPICASLRPAHREALLRMGTDPRRRLRQCLCDSPIARTALIDGRPVAMWGVRSATMSGIGEAWVALSCEALKFPISILREARRQMADILERYEEVAGCVVCGDEAALRFATALGFHDREEGLTRKALALKISEEPVLKIAAGSVSFAALGYHRD